MLRRRLKYPDTNNNFIRSNSFYSSIVPSYTAAETITKSSQELVTGSSDHGGPLSSSSRIIKKMILFLSVIFVWTMLGYWKYLVVLVVPLPKKTSNVIRISAKEHANLTQFVPCISNVSSPSYSSKIKHLLKSHRKLTREPSFDSLSCIPPDKNKCFRGVYDGFTDFLPMVEHNIADLKDHDEVIHKIALLLESLILHPEVPFTSDFQWDKQVSLLQLSVKREKTYDIQQQHVLQNDYCELHVDYFERKDLVYTAILYGDPSDDLLGGETAIMNLQKTINETSHLEQIDFGLKQRDEANTDGSESNEDLLVEFTSGLIIEPKPGRLVLFSGGGENFHTPVEVKRGTRPTFHFWFKCKA